jgi:hypothetical protein
LISKELDSVLKYHILEPTWPHSSVGRAFPYKNSKRFHMCEISHVNLEHVKFHMWDYVSHVSNSHVKLHMWNFTCEVSHVKHIISHALTCEKSHVPNSHVKIHMWNFTCETHNFTCVHMWNITCSKLITCSKFTCKISHVKLTCEMLWQHSLSLINTCISTNS